MCEKVCRRVGPEFGACQDAPGLLVRHSDQGLFVDGHQLVPDLQPAVLNAAQTHRTGADPRV